MRAHLAVDPESVGYRDGRAGRSHNGTVEVRTLADCRRYLAGLKRGAAERRAAELAALGAPAQRMGPRRAELVYEGEGVA